MLTQEQIDEAIEDIGKMSQKGMATMQRFAPVGHRYFDMSYPTIQEAWKKRLAEVGGMTPKISKEIGL